MTVLFQNKTLLHLFHLPRQFLLVADRPALKTHLISIQNRCLQLNLGQLMDASSNARQRIWTLLITLNDWQLPPLSQPLRLTWDSYHGTSLVGRASCQTRILSTFWNNMILFVCKKPGSRMPHISPVSPHFMFLLSNLRKRVTTVLAFAVLFNSFHNLLLPLFRLNLAIFNLLS